MDKSNQAKSLRSSAVSGKHLAAGSSNSKVATRSNSINLNNSSAIRDIDDDAIGFPIDTTGLSAESKKGVSCLYKSVVNYFESVMSRREEFFKDEIKELHSRIVHLEDKLDAQENYGRRETLVLSGNIPAFNSGEDCTQIVTNLISTKLDVDIAPTDISISHRLGKKPNGGQDRRSIIFKLCRRELKSIILQACRTKKPPFYINESLSPTRSSIMFVLRKARHDFPTKFGRCVSDEGNVRLWIPNPDDPTQFTKITVNTRSDLEELMKQKTNCTSEKYNVSWR